MSHIARRALLTASLAGAAASALPGVTRAEATAAPTTPKPTVDMWAIPLINEIAQSPDGKSIAVVTQNGDVKGVVYFSIADMAPSSVALGKTKVRNLVWGSNDTIVVVRSATMDDISVKYEVAVAGSIDTKTSKYTDFFNDHGRLGWVGSQVGRLKIDGKYRVTFSTATGIYSVAPDTTDEQQMYSGSDLDAGYVFTPNGRLVALAHYDDFRKIWSLFFNTAPGVKNPTFKQVYQTKHLGLTSPDLLCLGRDGKSVVVRIYADAEGLSDDLYEISPDGVLSESLDPAGNGKTRAPLIHPVTYRLAGFWRDDDWSHNDYFDPLLKKLNEGVTTIVGEGYRSAILEFGDDPREVIAYSEGADDAGSYYKIDFTTGAITQVAENYPHLPTEWLSDKQAVSYTAADGLDIHGYLTLPPFKAAQSLPLVVLPHGGPQSRDRIAFDWQAQCLAGQGYAVLQPNFRGSSGYGAAFVRAGHGQWGRKMQTDLSDGVRWLVGRGLVDAKRVAIMGASYGGYAALAGATLDPGVYNCAISIAGLSDLKATYDDAENTAGIGSNSATYLKDFMGAPNTLDDISPVKHADKASCPVLLLHGTDDSVVPISHSRKMEKALKAAGKTVEFVTYPGQDHWETVGSTRIAMMKAALSFLDKYNPAT